MRVELTVGLLGLSTSIVHCDSFGSSIPGYGLVTTLRTSAPDRETPLETLQRHYAAGELSTEEYRERKDELSK